MAVKRKENKETEKASSSKTLPTMPGSEPIETHEVTVISDSQSTTAEKVRNIIGSEQDLTVTAELKYTDGQKVKSTDTSSNVQTPMKTSLGGCSTERANRRTIPDSNTTPQTHHSSRKRYSRDRFRKGKGILKILKANIEYVDQIDLQQQNEWINLAE